MTGNVEEMLRRIHLVLLKIYRRLPVGGRRWVVRRLTPSFTVGAICILERADGALLLVRHSYRRRWGFPGGLLQRRESAAAAARREAFEEVGLDIELVGEPAVAVDETARRVDVIFRARPAPGSDPDAIRSSSAEIVDIRWFHRRDLPELQHEAAGALVAVARAASPGIGLGLGVAERGDRAVATAGSDHPAGGVPQPVPGSGAHPGAVAGAGARALRLTKRRGRAG